MDNLSAPSPSVGKIYLVNNACYIKITEVHKEYVSGHNRRGDILHLDLINDFVALKVLQWQALSRNDNQTPSGNP